MRMIVTLLVLLAAVPAAAQRIKMHTPGGNVEISVEEPGFAQPEAPPAQEPRAEPAGMSASDFEALVDAIKDEGFEDGKLNVLSSAAQSNRFTANQVGEILDLMAFSEGKLKALGKMKHRIVDRNNTFKIYKHFAFSADQKKARKILTGH